MFVYNKLFLKQLIIFVFYPSPVTNFVYMATNELFYVLYIIIYCVLLSRIVCSLLIYIISLKMFNVISIRHLKKT